MQSSTAFKILWSRLNTMPSSFFTGKEFNRILSEDQQSQISHQKQEGSQIAEGNEGPFIDFVLLLQKFKDMRHKHHIQITWELSGVLTVSLHPSCPRFSQLYKALLIFEFQSLYIISFIFFFPLQSPCL